MASAHQGRRDGGEWNVRHDDDDDDEMTMT
jgi:hypothetical protein